MIDDYINVGEIPHLLNSLETKRFQQIIIFTNFPPNHFYKINHFDFTRYEFEAIPKFQVNKNYSFSTMLYYNIFKKYQEQIVEVNFITSAKKSVLDDSLFNKITVGINTRVQRKRDWFRLGIDYNELLKGYILKKAYSAVYSILFPNPKFLLKELMANFCQN